MQKKVIFIAIVCLVTSSCGTIFGGRTQSLTVYPTNGSDVEVEITDGSGVKKNATIPTTVEIKRSNKNLSITVKETDCYKRSQSFHRSTVNMFFLLNLLGTWSSSSSTTTDFSTGGMWSYDNTVSVNVSKKPHCK